MSDAMTLLAEAARKQVAEEQALAKINKARRSLIFANKPDHCFWATLALRPKIEVRWDEATGATNGVDLFINPDFVVAQTDEKTKGFVAHETGHNADDHFRRRGNREPRRWNVACDLAINPLLVAAGFELPDGALMPGIGPFKDIPKDLSAEAIYALLPTMGGDGEDGEPGDPGDDPGKCGRVVDAGDEAAQREASANWRQYVAQSVQVAKGRGELSAGLSRWVDGILKPIVDPWEVIRAFLQRTVKADLSWSPPNRRFIHQGLYLPGPRTEVTGDIVLFVDQSGSISEQDTATFAAGIEGIVATFPGVKLRIAYHDTKICGEQEWEPSEGELVLKPSGGGGTSHLCCWDYLNRLDEEPSCAIAFSDCDTNYGKAPSVPLLWAVVTNPNVRPPFGIVAHLEGKRC